MTTGPRRSGLPGSPRKRSIMVAGTKTSVSLEEIFWDAFDFLANHRAMTHHALATEIDRTRESNLSSAIRVYCMSELVRLARQGRAP
jgi:predicted DNA-binding ribbon-helix-helix protein